MRTGMWAMAASAALFVSGASVQADTLYNQNVATPGPGWINGTGTANGGFTVTTQNDVEVGMRAKYRQNPAIIESPNNLYTVVAGPQTAATSGGPAAANRAAWNYEFSIYTAGAGMTISDILAELTITNPNGDSATVNPLTHWSDNTGYDGTKQQPAQPGSTLAQNSQNAVFGDFPLTQAGYPFNMWTTGIYTFDLNVTDLGGTSLAATSIQVQVVPVPLPSSAWGGLAMMGVAGGMVLHKRLRAETSL